MVKLSVSKAARMLGISRFDIQNQINSGKLQTHEGYVTTDSLRLAYPNAGLNSEQDQYIQKMQQIKNDAIKKIEVDKSLHNENEKSYMGIINNLKSKLYEAQVKNQHYQMVFSELTERLEILETHCHSQDKASLHKLQGWVKSQH
ncbi:hypothetical protein THERMOT_264 [Bathymodiolus thermophilus thioautotrophic gill symbiont]|uniref:hypothetical protein n=1 Tax=Bathymodiolus thermophilus thioautotrophic gill symbiont TaxID=2360 RepID=UPI00192A71F2|nr:hypothetical protein [Bathymodiolus thermophilus thioautotrophic gill symbiont]CAB5495206.1 hypothetical protein THERMOT_264 [Bathymodiolus thermophilus thioautotrophic gill symbiont]